MTQIAMTQNRNFLDHYLAWSRNILTTIVWISSLAFGLYILGFYVAELILGDIANWNVTLPDVYEEGERTATAGISLHFVMGAVILILGTVQFIPWIRHNLPKLHRILGRVYVVASILTAIGGLVFIFMSGTVGGTMMNIAFGLYGVLMLVSGVETARHARARRFEQHNNWALRLYVLGIGSWLYRMFYGIWALLADFVGHNDAFTGPFDIFMNFAFYVPSLILVEMMIRSKGKESSSTLKAATSIALSFCIVIVGAATYFAVLEFWLPSVKNSLGI